MSISTFESSTETALVVIPSDETSVQTLFTSDFSSGLEPILSRIKREVAEFQKIKRDPTSREDREEIKAFARKLVKTRTGIEALGKALADRLKLLPKKNDENRRTIRVAIENLEVDILAPVSAWEATEKKRIDDHIADIRALEFYCTQTAANSSDALKRMIDDIEKVVVNSVVCQEFEDDYRLARDKALASLRAALATREQYERDQAELATLRAAQAERDAKERTEREAREASERAERENRERIARDHQAAIDAAQRAQREAEQRERDAIAAAESARLRAERDAAEAERRRLEAEAQAKRQAEAEAAAQKVEEEHRAKNKAHRARVNNIAAEAIRHVIDNSLALGPEATAKEIIKAIASGLIPAVTINY